MQVCNGYKEQSVKDGKWQKRMQIIWVYFAKESPVCII